MTTAEAAARHTRRRPLVQRVARLSLLSRAVVYLVLAAITARIASFPTTAHRANSAGVLAAVERQPAGPELVALLGVGFVAYAAWRVLQAVGGDPSEPRGDRLSKRIGWAGIAVIYLALAAEAALVAVAGRASHPSSPSEAAHILAVPGGRVLLFVVGFAIVCGGVGLVVWALLLRFEVYLPEHMPSWADGAAKVAGMFGSVTRGAVFAAIGATLAAAAVAANAAKAKGLSSALHALTTQAYGRPLLGVIAAGFVAFAAMSLLEAFFRRI